MLAVESLVKIRNKDWGNVYAYDCGELLSENRQCCRLKLYLHQQLEHIYLILVQDVAFDVMIVAVVFLSNTDEAAHLND